MLEIEFNKDTRVCVLSIYKKREPETAEVVRAVEKVRAVWAERFDDTITMDNYPWRIPVAGGGPQAALDNTAALKNAGEQHSEGEQSKGKNKGKGQGKSKNKNKGKDGSKAEKGVKNKGKQKGKGKWNQWPAK